MVPVRLNPLGVFVAAFAPCSTAFAQSSSVDEPPAVAQEGEPVADDAALADLSLEDLMSIEVSVASRHSEKLIDAPAAVYVLTGDELRRAGVTSVQEALRMVPGFHVARWRTQGWDVTARGFTGGLSSLNQSFANQLLLMVDGVSVYSPLMAGIWWPLFDVPIQDVERIEIIRGPAGTLWGANAMNGVIHVITKHARDTQGAQFDATVQRNESSGDLRYGSTLGGNGFFRVWASSTYVAGLPLERRANWTMSSVGFRGDWDLADDERTRLMGTLYGAEFGPSYAYEADQPKAGGWISGTYERGGDDDLHRFQAWYWLDHQSIPDNDTTDYNQDLQTLDVEYTRRFTVGESSSMSFGVGGRIVQSDSGSDDGYIDFDPEFDRFYSARAFAQGQIGLPSLNSQLVAGLQAEESTLGGFQVQPNVRWLWRPSETTSVWAAASRAVRTPSIEETTIEQRLTPLDTPFFVGNHDQRNEELLAFELGLRAQITENVDADLTVFVNDYDDLQTLEELDPTTTTYGNEARATAHGAELALDTTVTEQWRLRTSYTYFEMDFEAESTSFEAPFIDDRDDLVPVHHVALRSYYDLGDDWELDSAVYWVDRLPYFDVDSYFRVDARLGWRPTQSMQLSIGVQNATDPKHPEAGPPETERNVYVSLRMSF